MPQPINRIIPEPHVYLTSDALKDKPDMAILVCQIFAVWARIEHQLSFLLVRVLGADSEPALAMYATLTAQHLQLGALQAAAAASLAADDFEVFKACAAVAESVQKPRNHLAHWIWASCKQLPELLCLADPKMLHKRDFRVAKLIQTAPSPWEADLMEVAYANLFDHSEILAYSKPDLDRTLRDLNEAHFILLQLSDFLDPTLDEHLTILMPTKRRGRDVIRAEALQKLNEQRLFREALARIRGGQKSTPPPPSGPNPQGPVGSS
jgi:hypothetical protein